MSRPIAWKFCYFFSSSFFIEIIVVVTYRESVALGPIRRVLLILIWLANRRLLLDSMRFLLFFFNEVNKIHTKIGTSKMMSNKRKYAQSCGCPLNNLSKKKCFCFIYGRTCEIGGIVFLFKILTQFSPLPVLYELAMAIAPPFVEPNDTGK